MNPIDSYKSSFMNKNIINDYSKNNNIFSCDNNMSNLSNMNNSMNNSINNRNNQINISSEINGFFDRFPESTRESKRKDLRELNDRNMNHFKLENNVLSSADLIQNVYSKNNKSNIIPMPQDSNNNNDNRRDASNNRLQNLTPIPTNRGIPVVKNIQADNRIDYPIQTRNMNYKPINLELEKKNNERSNF